MRNGVRGVLKTALAYWAEHFDDPRDSNSPLSGADMIEFFTAWRIQAREADQSLRVVIDTLEAWHDDADRCLRTCLPRDEERYRNVRNNYRALLDRLAGPLPARAPNGRAI